MSSLKNICLSLIIISFGITLSYWSLPETFFQQDEWIALASYIIGNQTTNGTIQSLINAMALSFGVHWTPLTVAFLFFQIHFFKLFFPAYAMTSIILHIMNTFLLFFLFQVLTKKNKLAFAGALLFGMSSISSQSVAWISTSVNNLPAMFFLILSVLFATLYMEHGEKHIRYVIASSFFLLVGLLFKESVFFLFFFLPFYWILFTHKKSFRNFLRFTTPFSFLFGVYVAFRVIALILSPIHDTSQEHHIYPWQQPTLQTYIYRGMISPIRILPQGFIPSESLLNIAEEFVSKVYPYYFVYSDGTTNEVVSQTIAFDLLCFFIFVVILIFSSLFYIMFSEGNEQKKLRKILIISLLFMGLSSLPFIFIGGQAGYSSIYEPRHLYNATLGSSLFLSILAFGIYAKIQKKIFSFIPLVVLIIVPLVFHFTIIQKDVENVKNISSIRKYILGEILEKYPSIPQKTIFYMQSDTAYYGLADNEKIPPFQSGFGQVLLVWYTMHGTSIPACFFAKDYLYLIESQGYKECDERGFGYFRKLDSLQEAIKAHRLPTTSVIAFSYNAKQKILTDITPQIQETLRKRIHTQ